MPTRQLHVAFSILFISFSGCALANHLPIADVNLLSKKVKIQSAHPSSILSVFLYLPLIDNAAWSFPMAQNQMTVTPTLTYTVRAIRVDSWDSQDGTCTLPYDTETIDNGGGNTVTLINGYAYRTTDASNFALSRLIWFNNTYDEGYQLLDNNLNPIGAYGCIQGDGAPCNSSTNCGWSTPQFWTP